MRKSAGAAFAALLMVCLSTIAFAAGPIDTTIYDYQTKVATAPGRPKGSVFESFENNESVSLLSGNLLVKHASSPTYSDNGMTLGLTRAYNSNFVRKFDVKRPMAFPGYFTPVEILTGRSWVGYGWRMHLGRVFKRNDYLGTGWACGKDHNQNYSYSQGHTYFEDAEGTEHEANKEAHPQILWNYDAPNNRYVLTLEDGTRYELEKLVDEIYDTPTGWNCSTGAVDESASGKGFVRNSDRAGWYVTKISDVHGNQIRVDYWRAGCVGANVGSSCYPEAIKAVYFQNASETKRIETDLCEQTDVDGGRCPASALGMLRRVRATGFLGDAESQRRTVTYDFFYEVRSAEDDLGTISVAALSAVRLPLHETGATGEIRYRYRDGIDTGHGGYGPLLEEVVYPTSGSSYYTYGSWVCGARGDKEPCDVPNCPNPPAMPQRCTGVVARQVRPVSEIGQGGSWHWARQFSTTQCVGGGAVAHNEFRLTRPDRSYTVSVFAGNPCGGDSTSGGWDYQAVGPTGFPRQEKEFTSTDVLWRTTQHDYDCGPISCDQNDNAGMALERRKVVFFNDAATGCFGASAPSSGSCTFVDRSDGAVGSQPVPCQTTEYEGRTAWNQWRMTKISGTFMRGVRTEFVKYEEPSEAPSCRASTHVISKFREAFVEEGPVGSTGRYELRFTHAGDSDSPTSSGCGGEMTSSCARQSWASVTGTASPVPACGPSDVVSEMSYNTATGILEHVAFKGGDPDPVSGDRAQYDVTLGWARGIASWTKFDAVAWKSREVDPDDSGLLRATIDSNGYRTSYSFDELGRLTRIQPPGEAATRVIYPTLLRTRIIRSLDNASQVFDSNPEQEYVEQEYDGLGRLIASRKAMPDGTLSIQVQRYDDEGRVVFKSEWMSESQYGAAISRIAPWTVDRDGNGSVDYTIADIPGTADVDGDGTDELGTAQPWGTVFFFGTPTDGNPLHAVADGRGKPSREVRADGSFVDRVYCGPHDMQHTGTNGTIDTSSRTVHYYDALGRLAVVDAPAGADAEYRYDARGKLVRANLLQLPSGDPMPGWKDGTLPRGQIRRFEYDAAGRLRKSDLPEKGRGLVDGAGEPAEWDDELSALDPLGNPLVRTDAFKATRHYRFRTIYDGAGRPLETRLRYDAARDLIGSDGRFDTGLGGWLLGGVDASGGFDSSQPSSWRQADYGGCLPGPAGSESGDGALVLDGLDCSYNSVPAGPQIVRRLLSGVRHEDVLRFKYWRQVREEASSKDAFSVWVTLASQGAVLSDKRVLFHQSAAQKSFARWRSAPEMRPGDLFSDAEWPEDTAKDLYVYIVFEKGDSTSAGLGTGVMVDDMTLGHPEEEVQALMEYDQDHCLLPGVGTDACRATHSGGANNQLTTVTTYTAGRPAFSQRRIFRGLGGRLSAIKTEADWTGALLADRSGWTSWVTSMTYNSHAAIDSVMPAHLEDPAFSRKYSFDYAREMQADIRDEAGVSFFNAGAGKITYDPSGAVTKLSLRNGTTTMMPRDIFGRPRSISISRLGGLDPYWASGNCQFDAKGNITAIGAQTFSYDQVDRLVGATVLPQAGDRTVTVPEAIAWQYDPFGNLNVQDMTTGTPKLGFEYSRSSGAAGGQGNRNHVVDPTFSYDLAGNLVRMTGKVGQQVGSCWTPDGRMTVFLEGEPWSAGGLPTESYEYDPDGYRWLQWDRTGTGRATIRDVSGQALSSFLISPSATTLESESVYGAGQLLVERLPSTVPASVGGGSSGSPGSTSQRFQATRNSTPFTHDLTISVTDESGYSTYSSTAQPDASGGFEIPNTAFAPGVTNLLRVKASDDPTAPYSAPASVMVDDTVGPSSPNQIQSMTISRSGADIMVRWTLAQSNGKKTLLYFRRADTGTVAQVTPQPLQVGVTSYTVPSQALAAPEGRFFARQQNADQSLTPATPATSNPPSTPGIGEASAFVARYQHRDHLGSLRIVTDDAGLVARDSAGSEERHDYYPFGDEIVSSGRTIASGSRRKFTGHERDEASGLDYMLARYHSPALGRFLSVDPGFDVQPENPQSWNLYAYVRNNPVNAVDPDGREIDVKVHPVAAKQYHTAVLIIPADQARYANDPRFLTNDSGQRYATIGAGPLNLTAALAGIDTPLVSGVNRERDADLSITSEILPVDVGARNENEVIESLFTAEQNLSSYSANNTTYALFPTSSSDRYNSNSFTTGLLGAVGLDAPQPTLSCPGYDKPIPEWRFEPNPPDPVFEWDGQF